MSKSPFSYSSTERVDETDADYEKNSAVLNSLRRYRGVGKMHAARKLLYGLLACIMLTFGLATAVFPYGRPYSERNGLDEGQLGLDQDDSTFSKLLSSASPDTIHKLLHAYFPGTFKHGIYSSDETALEALRSNDAALATSLVQLAKRQNDSSVGPDPVTTTVVTVSTTVTETTTPPVTESSTTPSPPPPSSTTPEPTPTTTPPIPPSSTTESPTTPPTTPPTDPPTSQPTTPSTTPPPDTTPSSALPPTTTPGPGTTTPGTSTGSTGGTTDTTLSTSVSSGITGSVSRKTTTFTSTLPGGGLTTITSVEIVTGDGGSGSPTAGGTGSLQTGLAVPNYRGAVYEAAMIGAVIGGALLV